MHSVYFLIGLVVLKARSTILGILVHFRHFRHFIMVEILEDILTELQWER